MSPVWGQLYVCTVSMYVSCVCTSVCVSMCHLWKSYTSRRCGQKRDTICVCLCACTFVLLLIGALLYHYVCCACVLVLEGCNKASPVEQSWQEVLFLCLIFWIQLTLSSGKMAFKAGFINSLFLPKHTVHTHALPHRRRVFDECMWIK